MEIAGFHLQGVDMEVGSLSRAQYYAEPIL